MTFGWKKFILFKFFFAYIFTQFIYYIFHFFTGLNVTGPSVFYWPECRAFHAITKNWPERRWPERRIPP
jgi:hypothetical protein